MLLQILVLGVINFSCVNPCLGRLDYSVGRNGFTGYVQVYSIQEIGCKGSFSLWHCVFVDAPLFIQAIDISKVSATAQDQYHNPSKSESRVDSRPIRARAWKMIARVQSIPRSKT